LGCRNLDRRHQFGLVPLAPALASAFAPKVSIHIPAEPPEMLKATLDAVARLNYPNFECVIVINNTPNPAYWEAVEAHAARLGDRFHFLNAPKLDGYASEEHDPNGANRPPDRVVAGARDNVRLPPARRAVNFTSDPWHYETCAPRGERSDEGADQAEERQERCG
jgi:cellulose synthase/poly-beta-1,6-N-acetylglucosamine synthase-like glycosyltransferase